MMSKLNIKRIEYDLQSQILVVDDGQDFRFQLSRSDTDIYACEVVEDFIVRHGGLTEAIASLSKV